jgi:hypothetical protein
MSRQSWVAPWGPFHVTDGAAFTTFTAFQDVTPDPPILLPANLLEVGSELHVEAWGEFSNTGTPTLGLGIFYGTAAVALGSGTPLTTITGAASWPWHLEYMGRVRSVGTAGSIVGQGIWELGISLTAFSVRQALAPSLATRTVAIDTTTQKEIGVGATWGTSSGSNSIKVNHLSVRLAS